MPSPLDLRRTQTLFWDLITAPEGVTAGLKELAAAGRLPVSGLASFVKGDERVDAAGRLDIYANMYFYRLRDSLAEDFPKLLAVLGGARFHNLITDYLLAHPSSFWSLRDLGKALPAFVRGHALSADRPYLADLADLEWARSDLFDEEDAPPLGRDRIASLKDSQLDRIRIAPVPASRALCLDWNVAPLWRQLEESPDSERQAGITSAAATDHAHLEEIPPAVIDVPERRRSWLRVWRRDFRIYHRSIRVDEHACLLQIRQGVTLARLGEIVFESLAAGPERRDDEAAEKAAVRRMAALLEQWLEEGLLREVTPITS